MLTNHYMNHRLTAHELLFTLNVQVLLMDDLYRGCNAEHVLTQILLWYYTGTKDYKDQDWQINRHQPSLLENISAAFIARHGGLEGFCRVFNQWIQPVSAHSCHSQQDRLATSRQTVADVYKEPQVGVLESIPCECNAGEFDAPER